VYAPGIRDEPGDGDSFELIKADWDVLILGSETFARSVSAVDRISEGFYFQ
jgi:hypothetical protein